MHAVEINAVSDSIKIDLSGRLSQGRLDSLDHSRRRTDLQPQDLLRQLLHYIYRQFSAGSYIVHFKLEDTRGELQLVAHQMAIGGFPGVVNEPRAGFPAPVGPGLVVKLSFTIGSMTGPDRIDAIAEISSRFLFRAFGPR